MFQLHLLLFLVLNGLVDGKVSEGVLQTDKDFSYLDRFCYESDTGQLDYYFRYSTSFPTPSLLLYYDDPKQWLRAYTVLKLCEERVELLTNASGTNGIVRLTPLRQDPASSVKCVYQNGEHNSTKEFIICRGTKTFRSRWWFMAISTCGEGFTPMKGIRLEYRLVMTNGEPTDIFTYQFSFDQRYMLFITIICTGVCGTLFIAAYIVGWQLAQRRLHHGVYKVYSHCIFVKCLGLICYLFHFFLYAVNGYGLPTMEIGAQAITYGSEIMFLTMLLVLSRGMNVTKMKLSTTELAIIGIFILTIGGAYIALHVWEIEGYDPALVYFYSESLPGKLIAIWKIAACGFVIISCLMTMKEASAKRWFYTGLMFFYTPW